ncbi:MAG: aminotransferase class I/II-fold pyridoxal phosphate-dependent enzyme [Nitriliruptorales bacterium]|nr:aminotransferase class I/II-fold pyridoxal phosphate-dependent enzyme [Nitriliruptorales bacterium]
MISDLAQSDPARYGIDGRTASQIAASVEGAVTAGTLAAGDRLPSVRRLAEALAVSPATVASAFRTLRQRGVLVTRERSGARISGRPPLAFRPEPHVPSGAVDLASGNPDPALLPRLSPALARIEPSGLLYGDHAIDPRLRAQAEASLSASGVPASHIAVVGGAMDGVERVLGAHLQPGDQVLVEDPGYHAVLDLVRAMALVPRPVPLDAEGALPDALARALTPQARALVLTPRAQNPGGSAVTAERAIALREVMQRADGVLVVEDDHAGGVAGAPHHPVAPAAGRWAVIRSVGKSLGPDLRLAVLAADAETAGRIEGRQRLGTGWVSHLLQRMVATLWEDPQVRARVQAASEAYGQRRAALLSALVAQGITAQGASGLNVWIPVREEETVVTGLLGRGWAVRAGERFRLDSPAAVRVTTSALTAADATRFAADLAAVLHASHGRTHPA